MVKLVRFMVLRLVSLSRFVRLVSLVKFVRLVTSCW